MRVAAIVAALGAVALLACGSEPSSSSSPLPGLASTPQPSVAAGPAVDHTVLVVTGTGYQTTQPFKIPSSEFTLSWTLTGDSQYGSVSFFIYNSSGDRVDEVLDAKPGTDTSTIHAGKDVFFMTILDANATYKATVTAKYPGPDQIFSLPAMSKVTSVSGSGSKSTPTFHVSGNIWRITVRSGKPSKYTSVSAFVYKQDDSASTSQTSVDGSQGGSLVTSYVYDGPGDYYIKVLSANTTWTVTVEQTGS